MPEWKRVKVDFPTVKLKDFITPVKATFENVGSDNNKTVYGVTNVDGICITGKEPSKDISNYIVLEDDCFAYNPYRINVGSLGINDKHLKGCVSPAYVVFKIKNTLSPKFLYRYLKSDFGNHLINWYGNKGGVRNALRFSDLGDIDIPDIPFEEQIKVLNKLETIYIFTNNLSQENQTQSNLFIKLRQAILQEAIEGKLTADWRKENPVIKGDPNYDAQALLEKIKAEKEKLIAGGRIKKQKPLSPIKDEEKPFDLPKGWVWSRLGEVGFVNPRNYVEDDLDVAFSPMSLISEKFAVQPKFEVRKWKDIKSGFTHFAEDDVAIAKITPCFENSKACVFKNLPNKCGAGTTELHILRPIEVNSFYIYIFFKTSNFINKGKVLMKGAVGQKRIPIEYFENTFFPLPPLSEQNTIVNHVKKLLNTISDLKQHTTEQKEHGNMLIQVVLREAFSGQKLS